MKKIVSILLLIAMVLGLVIPSYANVITDANTTFNVTYTDKDSNSKLSIGDKIKIAVSISGLSSDLECSTVALSATGYDNTKIKFARCSWKLSVQTFDPESYYVEDASIVKNVDDELGSVSYVVAPIDQYYVKPNGLICEIECDALKIGDYRIGFEVKVIDSDNNTWNIPAEDVNISVLGETFGDIDVGGVENGKAYNWTEEGKTVSFNKTGNTADTTLYPTDATESFEIYYKATESGEYEKITPANNTVKDLGYYKVTASLEKIGYNKKSVTEEFSIVNQEFSGYSFTGVSTDSSKPNTWKTEGYTVQLTGGNIEGAEITYKVEKKTGGSYAVVENMAALTTAPTLTDVGEYRVTATLVKDGFNTPAVAPSIEFSIVNQEFSGYSFTGVSIDPEAPNYWKTEGYTVALTGSDLEDATITYKVEKKVDGDYAVVENMAALTKAPTLTDVGEYKVTATLVKEGFNSPAVAPSIVFSIVNQQFNDIHLTLDSAVVIGEYTYDGTLLVPGVADAQNKPVEADISYTVTYNGAAHGADAIKNAGTYTISAKVNKAGFDEKSIEEVTFVVKKAPLTIEGLSIEDRDYNATTALTLVENNVKLVGIMNNDSVEYTLPTAAPVLSSPDAGVYSTDNKTVVYGDIIINNNNYELTQPTLDVTISKFPVTVKAQDKVKTVKTEDPPLTVEIVEKDSHIPAVADLIVGTPERVAGEDVTEDEEFYTINRGTIGIAEAYSKNYEIKEFVSGRFTIISVTYEGIRINTEKVKKSYIVDELLDTTNLVVEAYYKAEGASDYTYVPVTPVIECSPLTAVDTYIVTVRYQNLTPCTYEITVRDKVLQSISANIKSITMTEGTSVDVQLKDLVVKGLYDNKLEYTLTAYDANDSSKPYDYKIEYSENLIVPYIPADTAGTVTIKSVINTIEPVEIPVTVVKKVLDGIAVTKKPDKTAYVEIDGFDKTGMEVTVTYNNGTTTVIKDENLTNITVVDKTLQANMTTVEISYTEEGVTKYAYVEVTVKAKEVEAISIVEGTAPAKIEYFESEPFNPEGLKIKVDYKDTDKYIIFEDFKGFNFTPSPLTAGTTEVKIIYNGEECVYSGITVKRIIATDIEITKFVDTVVDGDPIKDVITTVKAEYNNNTKNENFTDYKIVDGDKVFKLDNPTTEQKITVKITADSINLEGEKVVLEAKVTVTVLPCEATNEATGKNYQYFAAAVAEAAEGDRIVLKNDVVITEDIHFDKDITIATGANKLTAEEGVNVSSAKKIQLKFDTVGAEEPLELTVNGKVVTVEPGVEEYTVKTSNVGSVARQIKSAYDYIDKFYHNITAEKTVNGSISGRLKNKVGEPAKFTITPDAGYIVVDVIVDGVSVGAVTEYVFEDVRGDHTISAVFAEKAE